MEPNQPITLNRKSSVEERQSALQQIYAQVLERQPYDFERKLLAKQEKDFLSGKLGVRHFLNELGHSDVYLDNFYYNCSNLKFLEWCFKHFLGRALVDEAEIELYAGVLMKRGVKALISEILGSEEYRKVFGCFTIPYARIMKFYPSTQNFLQSQILNHEHVGQRGKIVPTIYWKQLGLDCETGVCHYPEHPEVSGAYKMTETSAPPSHHTNTLEEEIEDLMRMLQEQEDPRTAFKQMSEQQRSLVRNNLSKSSH